MATSLSQQHDAQRIAILGATGSIGESTLRVIAQHPEQYTVFALSGFSRLARLAEQVVAYQPEIVVVPEGKTQALRELLKPMLTASAPYPLILEGEQGLMTIAAHADVSTVMAAIVGAAGLLPTLAAIKAGKRVLLANKEALVLAGDLFMQAVKQYGATLLPVDSEHNAIFQCLPIHPTQQSLSALGVHKLILTASGGPFRTWTPQQLATVTPAQACKHPNWSMGKKISIDSATLMNKGLELIEACHLFAVEPTQVDVVIHPESIVHSLVQYVDGSTLAQLGNPDMCTPIAHALAWPQRIQTHVKPLDLIALSQLNFSAPDEQRFPCLGFARTAMQQGGTAPAVMNAANEVAVNAFLNNAIAFMDIPRLIDYVMSQIKAIHTTDLHTILNYDRQARDVAQQWLLSHGVKPQFLSTEP